MFLVLFMFAVIKRKANFICIFHVLFVERGTSAVECRTRNRERPGSNPVCFTRNCFVARMLPREVKLASEMNRSDIGEV